MELRHLRVFLVVADTLNISEAARQLKMSQPTLSRQIKNLEHAVGHALFVREPGELRLTPAGAKLKREGKKALSAVDAALISVHAAGGEAASVLRIGYYGVMWAVLVAPALRRFQREFPKVTPRLCERSAVELAVDLRDGRLDVAILAPGDTPRTRGIIARPALSVTALVALPADHPFAKKRQLALADLRKEKIISFARHLAPGRDRAFVAACKAAGFYPKISYEAPSMPELLMSVATRGSLAIVAPFAQRAPHQGVVFAKLEPPGVLLETCVAYTPHATPAARRLVELLIEAGQRVSADPG